MDTVKTKVNVSFVVSLHEFYVQIDKEAKNILYIKNLLNEENMDVNSEEEKYEIKNDNYKLEVGDLVSARDPKDNLLYRAQIIETFLELNSAFQEVEMALVKFIDYGNTANVTFSSLSVIQASLNTVPPLAIQCCLFDCLEQDGDAISEFSKLVMGNQILLEVMGCDEEGILHVDLVKEIDDNTRFTSVRDVLVLCGKAVFYTSPEVTIANTEERSFNQLHSLKESSKHLVVISHMHELSPLELPKISVQLLSDQYGRVLQLPRLMEEMDAVYGVKRSEELWGLGRCWPGMVCAVRDTRDKRWYRGEVVGVFRGRMVRVKYVDFGNIELVPAHRMRRLFQDFLELPALATTVSLGAMVEGPGTLNLLTDVLFLQDLKMKVLVEGGNDYLPIVDFKVERVSIVKWLHQFSAENPQK